VQTGVRIENCLLTDSNASHRLTETKRRQATRKRKS
jgi:hypothetical protein